MAASENIFGRLFENQKDYWARDDDGQLFHLNAHGEMFKEGEEGFEAPSEINEPEAPPNEEGPPVPGAPPAPEAPPTAEAAPPTREAPPTAETPVPVVVVEGSGGSASDGQVGGSDTGSPA